MRGGQLRHLVSIERRVQVGVDDHNKPNFQWQEWREAFAAISARRGREHFDVATKQRYSEEVYQFIFRRDEIAGLEPTMRFKVDDLDQVYDIKAILPDAQRGTDVIVECTIQNATLGSAALIGAIKSRVPSGTVGQAYTGFAVSASGGESPYSYKASGLPDGLSLSASNGAVSGTPTEAGTFSVIFTVRDHAGEQHKLPAVSITIAAA